MAELSPICLPTDRYTDIYLLTAIVLTPGGSSTVHIYTQTIHRTIQNINIVIYLLTAIGLTPGGSSTVHIYTQTIHRTIQNINIMIYLLTAIGLTPSGSSTVHIYTQTVHRTTQLIWEEFGPCLIFASYTLAFALQLRKCTGKRQSG